MGIMYILWFLFVAPNYGGYGVPLALGNDCEIIENGIDLKTKRYRIEVGRKTLLRHTPREIKDQLQEENLLNILGHLVKEDDDLALHLNVKVNSLVAREHFGSVNQGNVLHIILLDGKEIKLTCFAGSDGVMNQDRNGYVYPICYSLDSRQLKQLAKLEIDKIGMQWSSGYEEYPVYEVDFFLNQIACLNRAQNSN